MLYRKFDKLGFETSVIGLGTMRLPVMAGDNTVVDEAQAIAMIRSAIDQGVNYVDTAYMYHGGTSESVVGKALLNGYRERVKLVTKLPPWSVKKPEDMDRLLNEQLAKLQTNQLDIYLLHAMDKKYWKHLLNNGVFDFIKRIKADGRVKHVGFSFHDDAETFKEILSAYPWDVCMIQMNYVDKDTQATVAGLKLAEEKGIPVVIMEPLKGGQLVNPPEEVQGIFAKSGQARSAIEWSFKWLADFPGIKTILSGMSDETQLNFNLEIADRLMPGNLSTTEKELYNEAYDAFKKRIKVGCTQCNYCMPCPVGVNIPKNFKLYNEAYMYNNPQNAIYSYQNATAPKEKASACVSCKLCESKCPQKIQISDELKMVNQILGAPYEFGSFHWSY